MEFSCSYSGPLLTLLTLLALLTLLTSLGCLTRGASSAYFETTLLLLGDLVSFYFSLFFETVDFRIN